MNKIAIDISMEEIKVAIIEEDKLVELKVEGEDDENVVGNIYLGRVVNILQGMGSGFVDIGFKKNAYIHKNDTISGIKFKKENIENGYRTEEFLKNGSEIVVQVLREPFEEKGAKVTEIISLSGRYTILLPYEKHLGISRKIQDREERERLRSVVEKAHLGNIGCILRTESENADEKDIIEDIESLVKEYETILQKSRNSKPPMLIQKGKDIIKDTIRRYLNRSLSEILVNDFKTYEILRSIIGNENTLYLDKLRYFEDSHDMFGFLGLQKMIDTALGRTVDIKNGGKIVIDDTEALVAIDVNTAKFVGERNLQHTVLEMNLEATEEIARQIRLRNLSGMIIIDYIYMEDKRDRESVLKKLEIETRKDTTKTNIIGITKLGLVEMTRQKTRNSISYKMLDECDKCNGYGKILSKKEMFSKIENEIKRAKKNTNAEMILFGVETSVLEYMYKYKKDFKEKISKYYGIEIEMVEKKNIKYDELKIIRMGSKKYIGAYIKENN